MKKEKQNENTQKEKQHNPIQAWFYNLTHVRKNYKKVRASPYASLLFAIKVRKVVVGILIPYLIYRGIRLILDYEVGGYMTLVGRIIMFCIFAYIIYRIWKTIPDANKQLEYYKKYPHTINYCPNNVREDVDDIIKKIKENKEKKESEEQQKNPKSV